jgi:hypothetical protein
VCDKFEKSGLLYVSGELSSFEAQEYESHIAVCEECRLETATYRGERAELYTADILSERPNPAVDAEILRLCSNVRKAPVTFTPLLFFKRYVPVSVFLMLVAVAVGGYFRYHSMTADSLVSKYGGDAVPSTPPNASIGDLLQASQIAEEELAVSDSSMLVPDTGAPFSKTRGNMNLEGVVTVNEAGE